MMMMMIDDDDLFFFLTTDMFHLRWSQLAMSVPPGSQGEFLREMELDAVDHSVSPRRGKVISRIFAQGSIMINLSPPTGGASSVVP
jgi:hypothetical protein